MTCTCTTCVTATCSTCGYYAECQICAAASAQVSVVINLPSVPHPTVQVSIAHDRDPEKWYEKPVAEKMIPISRACVSNLVPTGGARVSGARGHRLFWRPPFHYPPLSSRSLRSGALEVNPLKPSYRGSEGAL